MGQVRLVYGRDGADLWLAILNCRREKQIVAAAVAAATADRPIILFCLLE